MASVSILAHPFDVDLCAALGVTDLMGVKRITLVIEPFKVTQVTVERELMTAHKVVQALTLSRQEV